MLLVILGAGASYDSLEPLAGLNIEDRPPLAAQLFDDREAFRNIALQYPAAFALFPRLRYQGRHGSIEATLNELQSEAAQYPDRIQQLAALRFYIRDIIADVETRWLNAGRVGQLNHHALFDQLNFGRNSDSVSVPIITFNYDTFAERALASRSHSIESLKSYIERTPFPLFKLHGSIDWSRAVDINGLVDAQDLRNGVLQSDKLIKYAPQWQETNIIVKHPITFNSDVSYVPAIAIPVESKTEFQCPEWHVAALKNLLPSVRRILTIGWRAQEQHFLKLLAECISQPVSLFCVSGDKPKSEETVANLRGSGLLIENEQAANMGFSHLVRTAAAQDFMKTV